MSAISIAATLTDTDLMLGVKSGQTDFMELLLLRHRKSVIHFLYRMVHDSAVAEDLAQDVFLKVYRARSNYEPTAQFNTWLYRIALNRAINWLRDNQRHRDSGCFDTVVATKASSLRSPEQELLRWEMKRQVRLAVEALPERQRVAVLLHKYGELEYTEIARVMGCSLCAVRALLNRAYTALRSSLAASFQPGACA